jgi:hypothetical protein
MDPTVTSMLDTEGPTSWPDVLITRIPTVPCLNCGYAPGKNSGNATNPKIRIDAIRKPTDANVTMLSLS